MELTFDYFSHYGFCSLSPPPTARSSEFATTSTDLAAFFACKGLPPLRIDPPLPGVHPALSSFIYTASDDLSRALEIWTSNSTTDLNPRDFSGHRRQLYSRAVSAARGGAL